jgi:CDP-diglyceride synthetase
MTTDQRRLQLTLWAAFVVGVAFYPTALAVIVLQWRPPYDADLLARLQVNCMLGAVVQTIAAFWFFRRGDAYLKTGNTEQRALWNYAVAWALSEAIGLYGLAAGLWRGEPEVSTLFFTWAISLILILRPPAARQSAAPLVPAGGGEQASPTDPSES